MAFFNLTQLGPQDPFKTALKKDGESKTSAPVAGTASAVSPVASNGASYYTTMYSPNVDHSWHEGSHLKYTEMLKKHQKSPEGMCTTITQKKASFST